MGFLDKFEKGVENVAHRAMSLGGSGTVEPIEIASKLRETMDKRAASFARDRSVVPNVFHIRLAPPDIAQINTWGVDEMAMELQNIATTHAAEQGYSSLSWAAAVMSLLATKGLGGWCCSIGSRGLKY